MEEKSCFLHAWTSGFRSVALVPLLGCRILSTSLCTTTWPWPPLVVISYALLRHKCCYSWQLQNPAKA